MITWMQTHKKWLIITIWIATIAFIGAGFVGWGAYSYGKKQDEVARIKNTSIKVRDIQDIYTQIYNNLNQMMGGKLDEATAEKLGLKQAAFNEAFKKALLIQFAKDNGLYITDEELAKTLISIPAFQKNGKFDKKLYKLFLRNIRMTAKEYETNLRKDLLVEKLLKAISLPSLNTTQETIGSYVFMEDKVSIKTLLAPKVEVTDNEIKTYWQKHKNEYKSVLSYDIGYFIVPLSASITQEELKQYYNDHKNRYTDSNGKILSFEESKDLVKKDLLAKKTKKTAILTMKKLKKGELKFNIVKNITLDNNLIPNTQMQKLISSKFLKPTLISKGWLIAKLIKINKPHILPYEKAKLFAKQDLIKEKRVKILESIAKKELISFKGKNIGFVGRDDMMKFKNLNVEEANKLLTTIFNAKKSKGFVLLPVDNPNKAVLFKITEQKLLNKSKYEKYHKMIVSYSDKLKVDELNKNLIKRLEKLYQAQIKIYMKI